MDGMDSIIENLGTQVNETSATQYETQDLDSDDLGFESQLPSLDTQPTSSVGTPRNSQFRWQDEHTEEFIEVLLDESKRGKAAGLGFKPEVWTQAQQALRRMIPRDQLAPDIKACVNKHRSLKAKYKEWEQLRNRSGWSLDRDTGQILTSLQAWEDFIAGNPWARWHQKNPLKQWKKLEMLFSGRYASGRHADIMFSRISRVMEGQTDSEAGNTTEDAASDSSKRRREEQTSPIRPRKKDINQMNLVASWGSAMTAALVEFAATKTTPIERAATQFGKDFESASYEYRKRGLKYLMENEKDSICYLSFRSLEDRKQFITEQADLGFDNSIFD